MSTNYTARIVGIGILILFIVFFRVILPIKAKKAHNEMVSRPRFFCYTFFDSIPNPCLCTSDLEDMKSIMEFNDSMLIGKYPRPLQIKLDGVAWDNPVYLIEYLQDSAIAYVGFYEDGILEKKYVDSRLLHKSPGFRAD